MAQCEVIDNSAGRLHSSASARPFIQTFRLRLSARARPLATAINNDDVIVLAPRVVLPATRTETAAAHPSIHCKQ